jgi:hypothetical protein
MSASPSPGLAATAAPNRGGDPLEAELRALSQLDPHDLRVRWRKLLRSRPPEHLGRGLLLRLLAYRLQARAYGDLDRETVRCLERIERERIRRRWDGQTKRKGPPPVPPVIRSRSLKPGTLLAREFGGRTHRVTVGAEGFSWNGSTYTSLSEIARLITGTRWNGPRFFGLRDKPKANSAGEGE